MHIEYKNDDDTLMDSLQLRNDPIGIRMKKLMSMPDLTRKENSPVQIITEAVLKSPSLEGCDIIEFPEIVTVERNFDLLNAPEDHPSRSPSDTYYTGQMHVLRAHTTAFWTYYLRDQSVLSRLENNEILKAVSYGKVYRRDEIDRNHYPVFHQIDGLLICKKERMHIGLDDLSKAAAQIAESIYGKDIVCREIEDAFPFTDPSIQLEIQWQDGWLELMGVGLVHRNVLSRLELDPDIYNGWAFGFGLDRLAMVKMKIPDIRILWLNDQRITRQFSDINSVYQEVSRFPSTERDISMIVDKETSVNLFYEAIRDYGDLEGEDMIEEVKLIDKYENPKFGGKLSYTFRIVYHSNVRTLTNEEVNVIQEKIRLEMVREFGVILR